MSDAEKLQRYEAALQSIAFMCDRPKDAAYWLLAILTTALEALRIGEKK